MLTELDERIPSPCDVLIVGGAAMILFFGARRATRDIDVIVLDGDEAAFRSAIRDVSRGHHLPENWVSDAVKGFADVLPPDFGARLQPLTLPLNRLHLYALGVAEQVAMKVVALREQDLEDLEFLLPKMSDSDKALLGQIAQRLSNVRPDWAQRIQYFMMERGWKTD